MNQEQILIDYMMKRPKGTTVRNIFNEPSLLINSPTKTLSNIRRMRNYELTDEWERNETTGKRYKRYWLKEKGESK